jgi:hypothetical protein
MSSLGEVGASLRVKKEVDCYFEVLRFEWICFSATAKFCRDILCEDDISVCCTVIIEPSCQTLTARTTNFNTQVLCRVLTDHDFLLPL